MSKFNNYNMYSPAPTPWTNFLKKGQDQDPYALFKDSISLMLETDALKIQNELLRAHPDYNKDVALKMAIALMMERLLSLQNEHVPSSMDSMVIALFVELPSLQAFRNEIINEAKYQAQRNKKPDFLRRWFGL